MAARRSRVLLACLLGACARSAPPPTPHPRPAPAPAPAPPPPAATLDATPRDSAAHVAPARTRQRRPLAPVRLAFVGDINLGTVTVPDGVPADSGRAFLAAAKPFLAGDLVIGNFEGVLADSGESVKCVPSSLRHSTGSLDTLRNAPRPGCYAFRTPTHLAPRLAEAGFTHLNLANNHANDFGLEGRATTEATLRGLGLDVYGPLGRVAIDTVARGGRETVIGIVGFSTYPFAYDLLDVPRSVAVVDSVRQLVDLLIVTFHGGTEGVAAQHVGPGPEFLGREPRGDLRTWTHAVIDAGADAVVGHGPHVLRGIEFRRGRLIAYSLGNFATYRGFSLGGPLGITGVLTLAFGGDGSLTSARLDALRQIPRQGPRLDPERTALRLVRDLSNDDFGADAARIADDGSITAP